MAMNMNGFPNKADGHDKSSFDDLIKSKMQAWKMAFRQPVATDAQLYQAGMNGLMDALATINIFAEAEDARVHIEERISEAIRAELLIAQANAMQAKNHSKGGISC
jgi:hypothetical protein